MSKYNIFTVILLLLSCCLTAQNEVADSTLLGQVTITSNSQKRDTTVVIDRYQSSTSTIFNRQASILALNSDNFAQDIRLSVRGFGARSAFGIRGVRMMIDGIPLTSPDGTTNIDELSVYDIHSTEVLTGGRGTIYGNAGGGAILLRSHEIIDNRWSINSRVTSLGSYDVGMKKSVNKENYKTYFSLQRQYFNGYRNHSDATTTTFYNKHQVSYNNKLSASYIVNGYFSPIGRDAGGLTIEQAETDATMANERNVLFDAGEKVQGGQLAAHHVYAISNNSIVSSTLYAKIRDFDGKIPSNEGIIDLYRKMVGAIHKLNHAINENLSIKIGHQYEGQFDDRKTSINSNGVKGDLVSARNEDLSNHGVFVSAELTKGKWTLSTQGRYDYGIYNLNDNDFVLQALNGSFAVDYKLSKANKVYVIAASTFESPTLNEFAAQAIPNVLEAEVARQLEVGYNYKMPKFNFDIKAFVIDLSQTIVAGENPNLPGVTLYNNGGSGFRNGIETSIDLNLSENWSFLSSASYNHFTLQSTNGDTKEQALTPDFKISFLSRYTNRWIDVNYLHLFISSMYLNSLNTVKSPNSLDAQITISTRPSLLKGWTIGIQVNNAYNTMKYSNYRINAAANRYYEIASPRHFGVLVRREM